MLHPTSTTFADGFPHLSSFRTLHLSLCCIDAFTLNFLAQVLAFVSALESRKVTASVRQTRGLDASAACGQLRNEFQKSPLLTGNAIQESHSVVALAS